MAAVRIRMLSGDEVASMPLEEVRDVREVKQRLHELHLGGRNGPEKGLGFRV